VDGGAVAVIPNGQFHDPSHIEQSILKNVDWLRFAVVGWWLGKKVTPEQIWVLLQRLEDEITYWQAKVENVE
jgi:hypothetical protein